MASNCLNDVKKLLSSNLAKLTQIDNQVNKYIAEIKKDDNRRSRWLRGNDSGLLSGYATYKKFVITECKLLNQIIQDNERE